MSIDCTTVISGKGQIIAWMFFKWGCCVQMVWRKFLIWEVISAVLECVLALVVVVSSDCVSARLLSTGQRRLLAPAAVNWDLA